MRPSKENKNRKYIKVVENAESMTLRTNGANVQPDILEYVRKSMSRGAVTGEVIGQAILFQEEMHREMSIIEAELMSKTGEEEAFGVKW